MLDARGVAKVNGIKECHHFAGYPRRGSPGGQPHILYRLTSSILAGDTYRALELTPKILAGIVNINSPTAIDVIHAPMGGVRDSGWERTGPDSLKEFQDVIWINSLGGRRQYPI
jgi:Aldehyde dehydrogenase family